MIIQGDSDNAADVIINGAGTAAEVVYLGHRTTVYNFTAIGADTGRYNLFSNSALAGDNIICRNGDSGVCFYISCTPTIGRIVARDNTTNGIRSVSGNVCKVNFAEVICNGADGILCASAAGDLTINNLTAIGNKGRAVRVATDYTGDVVVNNLVQVGSGTLNATWPCVVNYSSGGGTLTVNNAVTLPNVRDADNVHLLSVILGDGIYGNIEGSVLPLFKRTRYPVYVSFCIDDYQSLSFFEDFADLCDEFGFSATYALNTASVSAGDWATLQGLVARGHDIASHTVNHSDLTGLTAEQLVTELATSKAAIEMGIGGGFVCRTLVPPGNATNQTVQDAIYAAGYLAARGTAVFSTTIALHLRNATIYKIWAQSPSADLIKVTSPRRNIATILEYLGSVGGMVCFYGHNPAYIAGDYSLEQWRVIFEEIVKHASVEVMTFGDMAERLRTYNPSGDLTISGGGQIYTRTLIDEGDYSPAPGSILINNGANPFVDGNGDQYDMAGEKVWDDTTNLPVQWWLSGVDIGAYAYQFAVQRPSVEYPGPLGIDAPIQSGTVYPAVTIQAPLGAPFQIISEFTGEAVVDLATLVPTAKIRTGPRGMIVRSVDGSAEQQARDDRVVGA